MESKKVAKKRNTATVGMTVAVEEAYANTSAYTAGSVTGVAAYFSRSKGSHARVTAFSAF